MQRSHIQTTPKWAIVAAIQAIPPPLSGALKPIVVEVVVIPKLRAWCEQKRVLSGN